MLFVEKMKPRHRDDPPTAWVRSGEPFWVCGECHAPREKILRVVERAGEPE